MSGSHHHHNAGGGLDDYLKGHASRFPLAELIGFRLTSAGNGSTSIEFTPEERHANPMGTLHGGVLCDVADAAMGLAVATTLNEGESFTTLELKINFLKPVWRSKLEARGRIVRRGRVIVMSECDITDDEGSLVARASCTCIILRDDLAQGR
jgi:uncharacterized protein (TIGR00369 family)